MRNVLPHNHPNCCLHGFWVWRTSRTDGCRPVVPPQCHPVTSSDEEGCPHLVLGPVAFLVRPHQTSTHPHWNHNPWNYQVPSGSPQRQGSAIGFCKRETAIVWILSGVKDMGKPKFANSTGSEQSSRLSSLVQSWGAGRAANQAQLGHAHKLLQLFWSWQPFGVLVAKSVHLMLSITDPATIPTGRFSRLYIVFFPPALLVWLFIFGGGGEKIIIIKNAYFSCVGTCRG